MNEFVENVRQIAKDYHFEELEEKISRITPPAEEPYLKVAVISALNRLPNLLAGSEVLPDRMILANQKPVCITFDGTDDEKMETIHAENEKWTDIPIRFYVITWYQAFREDNSPNPLLDEMDFLIYGMDAATAFRRSQIEQINSVHAWDALIVVEELEKIPEDEMDEFIRVSIQRTERTNLTGDQIVFWHKEEPEMANAFIRSKLLTRWKGEPVQESSLAEFRRKKFEENLCRWLKRELRLNVQNRLDEIRRELDEEDAKVQKSESNGKKLERIDTEMKTWKKEMFGRIQENTNEMKKKLAEKNYGGLEHLPLTQKQVDEISSSMQTEWKGFIARQDQAVEHSLAAKIRELKEACDMEGGVAADTRGRKKADTTFDAPKSFWYSPALLAGAGVVSLLGNGVGLTLLLALPVLKAKQVFDRGSLKKKLEKANDEVAVELLKAYRKDLNSRANSAVRAFRQELSDAEPADHEKISRLTNEMRELCDLLEEYPQE